MIQMIELVTIMPDETADHKRGQKHPFIASELFGCECSQLLEIFFQNEPLLETLFSYLDHSESVSILDGYFSKVASLVLNKNPSKTFEFLSSSGKLARLPKRLFSKSISDLTLKLLSTDTNSADQCVKKDLLSEIVTLLNNSNEVLSNYASGLLIDLIQRLGDGPNVKDLVLSIASGENLKKIVDGIQNGEIFSVTFILEVLRQLLVSPIREELFKPVKVSEDDATVFDDEEPNEFCRTLTQIFEVLVKKLGRESEKFVGTEKKEVVRLGTDRLKIAEFFLTCSRLEKKDVFAALKECRVFETLTKLFVEFELNSFLHNLYESLVGVVFDQFANDEDVLRDLLIKSELLKHLSAGCETKGYAGQAVKIGTTLLKVKARNSEFSKYLESSEEWKTFYFEFYVKRSEIEKKTLGETKISDDLSSDDSGEHATEAKESSEAFLENFEKNQVEEDFENKKREEEDFERDEPEVDSEPLDIDDLGKEENENVLVEGKAKKGKLRYEDDEEDYGEKQVQEEISDEVYWRF